MGDIMIRTPDNAPGGDRSTVVDSLDLSTRSDCGLLRNAAKRWNISDRFKKRACEALENALEMATNEGDYRAIGFIVNTGATLEAQNQKDEERELERSADSGTVTIRVERTTQAIRRPDDQTAALPPGPAAHEGPRPTVQRGDVRPSSGQDDLR